MNQSKQFKITTVLLGVVLFVVVGVLSFFIVHNAQWLIGDDAIVINRTGWGIPFSIWDTIKPEIGRFFPLTYMHENLVLLFPGDTHNATQHYLLNMLLFVGLVVVLLKLMWIVIKPSGVIDVAVVFFSLMLCICRFYITYLNVFSTMYYYLTHTALFILFLALYNEKKHIIYAIFSLLLCLYMVFCSEIIFVIPLSLGILTLIFAAKQLTKQQIGFNIGMICIAVGFLIIYFFGIYLRYSSDSFYDPSHGTDVSFIENAKNILKGQKFLLLAALVWIFRQLFLIFRKEEYHVLYDSLLWTAGAILLGGLILKLNWQMYYYSAILYAVPSVVYFGYKYMGKVPTLIIVILFTGLHALKVPNSIKNNQLNRINTIEIISKISDEIKLDRDVIWYEAKGDCLTQIEIEGTNWIKLCVQSCIQYQTQMREWNYSTDDCLQDCVLLCPIEYTKCDDGFVCDEIIPDVMIADILIYYNYTKK